MIQRCLFVCFVSVCVFYQNFFVQMATRFVYGNVPFALEIRSALTARVQTETNKQRKKIFNENVINHTMNRMKEKKFINKPQCIWDELFLVWKDGNSWLGLPHANRYQVSQIECAICHFDRIWYVNHQLHSRKAFLLTIGKSIILQQVFRHPLAYDAVSRKK